MSATWSISAVLAVPFTLTSTSFEFIIGATTYTATVAAGTYRIGLASSSADILRVVAAAILAATPSVPGGMTMDVSLGDTGKVVFTSNNALKLTTLHSTLLGRILGVDAATSVAALVVTAERQPWYLALFCGLHGGAWKPLRSGASERTAGGVVYSFAGTLTSYDRELAADLIPWGPTEATEAECPATPFYPLPQYREALGVTSTARVWGLLDVWVAAQNAGASIGCALSTTWQTARTSTTERYDVGSLAADVLEPQRQDERWARYLSTQFSFVLPTSGQTGTRA